MEASDILQKVDHTLLSQTATWKDMQLLCDDAMEYKTASVCIPAHYVKKVVQYVNGSMPVCTVIGFPNGYSTTSVKVFEAQQAIADGAAEIDMVINLCSLKNEEFESIENEIKQLKEVCGDNILKVIIETCLLSRSEKIKMCEIVSRSGADFIKTSTGFSVAGATFEDVQLMKEHVSSHVKIKAAGGISTLDDARKFIALGADRLGTSRIIKLAKNQETTGY